MRGVVLIKMNATSLMRKIFLNFRCKVLIGILSLILVLLCIPFSRNFLLRPVWPWSWREMGITDVITLKFFSPTRLDIPPLILCPKVMETSIRESHIDQTKLKTYNYTAATPLNNIEHKRFLQRMSQEDKIRTLYNYMVLAKALTDVGVEFFFVEGSLLGVHRHRGMIPWDDDMDITVNLSDWRLVQRTLSCIPNFVLDISADMKWKFHPQSGAYPFVDIFFYTENACFLWAVTPSTALSLVFAKEHTFPLTTAQFEGIQVPVPKNTDHAMRAHYNDLGMCQSSSMNHKTITVFSEVSRIPCSHLFYLYEMFNIEQH